MKTTTKPFLLGPLASIAAFGVACSAHAASVTWNVAGGGTWDITATNWTGGSPDASKYVNGDTANFTNTAGGTIALSGTIAPTATNVSAASGTYTFSGSAITTGTLVKSGGGTLQLNASNSYAGGTTLNAGKLDINHATALGGGLLTINTSGTTFDNTSVGLISIANDITSTNNTVFAGTKALTTSGTYTYSSPDRTLTVNGSGTLTVGALAVSGGTNLLRKAGAGTLAITGASTASGIEFGASGGVVIAGNKASLGTSSLAVINGGSGTLQASTTLTGANKIANGVTLTGTGALTLSGSNDFEIGGIISSSTNTSKLTKGGVNTVTLSGANSYSGGTTISGGTLALSGSGKLGASTGALTFSGTGTTLNLGSTTQTVASVAAGDTATNISANITGGGGTLNASGTVVSQGLSGNSGVYGSNPTLGFNTGMVVSGATLIGRSNLEISGGTYSTSRFTSNAAGNADWGRLVISGSSVVTATNGVDATYGTTGSNGTTATFQLELNGGTLSTPLIKVANRDLNAAGPGGDNDANLIWNGGVVKATGVDNANFVQVYGDGSNTGPKQATYVSSGGAKIDTNGLNIGIQAKLLANPSSSGGGLTKSGSGTLTLTGANTYSGATTISDGTLSASNIVVSGSSNLGNAASAVALGAASTQGTLSYTGNSASYTRGFTIGGAGGGRLDVTTSGQTLQVITGNVTGSGLFTVGGAGNTTINANITHTGGMTKADGGTLTLSSGGTYSYSGATTVTGGKLVINGNISTSSTTVQNTGTLGGSGTVGAVIVQAGGTLAPGNSPGNITGTSLSLADNANFDIEIDKSLTPRNDSMTLTGNFSNVLAITTGANLNLALTGSFLLGDRFTLADYNTTNGTWNGGLFNLGAGTSPLADDSVFQYGSYDWRINYDDLTNGFTNSTESYTDGGKYLTLTVVPEPRAAMLGLIGTLILLRRQRG
jgi:fibronectin-binding autotransporter adhesin